MNKLETLKELKFLAMVSNNLLQSDLNTELSSDTPNGVPYRSYNLSEACSALGGVDHRKLKEILISLGENPETAFPINSVVMEKVKNTLFPSRLEHKSEYTSVYAVGNFKGGSGKSTCTVTLAAGLCSEIYDRQFRVGVIDLDPQGSATAILRPNFSKEDFTVGDILKGDFELEEGESFDKFVYESFLDTNIPNLKILPSKPMDRSYDSMVVRKQFDAELSDDKYAPHLQLKELIDSVKKNFDIILIDCSPNFGASVIAAHYAATSLIVPVRPSELDRDSSVKYFEFLESIYAGVIASFGHKGYDYINVLPAAVSEQSKTQREIAKKLRLGAKSNCFTANFLLSEAVSALSAKHQTIYSQSKSQYSGTQKTLSRIQEQTLQLVEQLYEQIQRREIEFEMNKTEVA